VTAVEADAILRSLATSTPARRAELSAMVRDASAEVRPVDAQRCVALRADETCAIYEARPMVCRSHGLVHRFREPDERRRLPLVDACEKNFRSQALAEIDADCIVDQVTLSTLLAAVDARFAAQTGTERGRIALSALLLGDDRSKIF
jgi:hypothetical protein